MRTFVVLLVGLACVGGACAQEKEKDTKPPRRYGVEADLERFPQDTREHALASVLKAIDQRKVEYLLAQLADPQFVDKRVQGYGGNFDEMVRETTAKLTNEPETVRQLRRFAEEGEWEGDEETATVKLKDVKDQVFLRHAGTRWFLENRKQPEPPAK
jgi:hypothetical protein